MDPHADGALEQAMQSCPMASPQTDDQQHGAMMGGDHAGQMMGQGQMTPGMHQGDMANCPMAPQAAPALPSTAPPADPHQH
jgi:hypothetical protein